MQAQCSSILNDCLKCEFTFLRWKLLLQNLYFLISFHQFYWDSIEANLVNIYIIHILPCVNVLCESISGTGSVDIINYHFKHLNLCYIDITARFTATSRWITCSRAVGKVKQLRPWSVPRVVTAWLCHVLWAWMCRLCNG